MSDTSLQTSLLHRLSRSGVSVFQAETPEGVRRLLNQRKRGVVGISFDLPAQASEMVELLSGKEIALAAIEPTGAGCTIYAQAKGQRTLTGELLGRLQRAGGEPEERGRVASDDGRVTTDTLRQAVVRDGSCVYLSCAEWEIFCCLAESPFRIWTREELIAALPRAESAGAPELRTIDAHVKNLRRKLEETPHKPLYLLTARSRGYYLDGFHAV